MPGHQINTLCCSDFWKRSDFRTETEILNPWDCLKRGRSHFLPQVPANVGKWLFMKVAGYNFWGKWVCLVLFHVHVWRESGQYYMPRFFFSQPLKSLFHRHFPKSISYKWGWPRRGGALEQEGPSSCGAWHRLQLSPARAELPFQLPQPQGGALAWLLWFRLPHITLAFLTQRGWRAALEGVLRGLCLSDPLDFIMNELLNPLYPGYTSSFTSAFSLP